MSGHSVFQSPKVELHVHLDGCTRHQTLWELAKKKNLPMPGDGSLHDIKKNCVTTEPKSLAHFLSPYKWFSDYYAGDFEATERIAYEFCEDLKRCNVVYCETRYNPVRFLSPALYDKRGLQGLIDITKQVIKGLNRGEQDFGIKVRSIISCGTWMPEVFPDVLKLCEHFQCDGSIVGIDLLSSAQDCEEAPVAPEIVALMDEARRRKFHTTIHAGEVSGPGGIKRALEVYSSDRIGHGYHVVQDNKLYQECLKKQVHFECCPWSSFLTAAVPFNVQKHPIKQFAEDGANFSLNSDDPTLTGYCLNDDYNLAASWGITKEQMEQINLNAAKAAFLPEAEKKDLIKLLKKDCNQY